MMRTEERKVLYPELSYTITGFCFEVQKELGRFCRERQYCDALEKKLRDRNISYEREKTIENENVQGNRIDFLVENAIILEAKSVPYLTKEDYFQTQRYLQAANKKLALVVNFRSRYLKPKRIINPLL